MTDRPSLSVIMANYNYGRYIREALDSVFSQSFAPSEVVITDDASTDDSVDVINEYARKHPEIVFLRNDGNKGAAYSFKRSLSRATGDYVFALSSDDKILPGFFEKSMDILKKYPQAGFCTTDCMIQKNGVLFESRTFISDRPRYFTPEETLKLFLCHPFAPFQQHSILAKRSALIESGGYLDELKWAFDSFSDNLLAFRHGFCHVPEVLTLIRVHGLQYSAQNTSNSRMERGIIRKTIDTVRESRYSDVLPMFRRTASFSCNPWDVLMVVLFERKYREFLSLKLVRFAISQKFFSTLGSISPEPIKRIVRPLKQRYRRLKFILGKARGREPMLERLRKLLRVFAINRAVLFGVMSKVWFGIGGFVTFLLIATRFTPELQGYYFTFYSLLSLQLFVEMGLSTVIINFASHEYSNLAFDEKGELTGDDISFSRLSSLAKQTFGWYSVGGLIITAVLLMVGFVFFSQAKQVGIHWQTPWIYLCIFFGVNFAFLPAFSLLEGCNQVSTIYWYRLVQEIVRSFSTWLVILAGFGLWSPALSTLAMLVWAVIFLIWKYRRFFVALIFHVTNKTINWTREVWPMQWRIAISWISGYFTFWLFTPVLFYFQGPVLAGRMGMSWSMINALLMISSMWVVTRAPQFGIHVAKKEYRELDALLIRASVMSVLIATLGAVTIFALISGLNFIHHPFAHRFLDPASTIFLLIATIVMQICSSQALYLRAHKQEPLVVVSFISAILMTFLVVFSASRWGALGVSVSYCAVVVLFMLPLGTYIFFDCRKKWHAADKIDTDLVQSEGI